MLKKRGEEGEEQTPGYPHIIENDSDEGPQTKQHTREERTEDSGTVGSKGY
jgi:hypothetical protein